MMSDTTSGSGIRRVTSFEFDEGAAAPATPASTDPLIGQDFDQYRVQKRLGESDRTDVYLAHHTELGTPVAVKIVREEVTPLIQQAEERFYQIIERRSTLRHVNIMQMLGAGNKDGRYFILTEYVDGKRLEEELDAVGVFAPEKAIQILRQITIAVQVAVESGIEDCSINPFNILVDKTGMAKVALFGISQITGDQVEDNSIEAAAYIAPDANRDGRGILYSLGCILYRMLSGRPPYAGQTIEDVQSQQQAPAPNLRDILPSIPKGLADLALSMMAIDPAQRPPSTREVLQALARPLEEQQAVSSSTGEDATGLQVLFANMARFGASDLHLQVGAPPVYRIRGEARRTTAEPFTVEQIEALFQQSLKPQQLEKLEGRSSYDFSMDMGEAGRFRINLFRQRGGLAACIRAVRAEIPSIEELLLPKALEAVTSHHEGMVLVTGPTGSGKSTTLAAMIKSINDNRRAHIITIEDPIEYFHRDNMSLVTQREIGIDTPDFLSGLRDAMRQDPDVILLGELRDTETVATAISASETGHLVMGTLHANNTVDTIGRVLNFFEHNRRQSLRELLGHTLKAIVGQRMVAGCTEQHPRIPIIELLIVNGVVAQCIADGEEGRLAKQFITFAHEGLQSFNMSFLSMVQRNLIHKNTALQESQNRKELESMLDNGGTGTSTSGQFRAQRPS